MKPRVVAMLSLLQISVLRNDCPRISRRPNAYHFTQWILLKRKPDLSDSDSDGLFTDMILNSIWPMPFPEAMIVLVSTITGNPGFVIVPQHGSSKITVFVWGKNTILQFLGNTK